jgi:hypothetical protein
MRGIERVADDAALGVAAIGLHSAHQQADELDAVTISGSRTAPSGASIPKHYPGMVPLGYDASGRTPSLPRLILLGLRRSRTRLDRQHNIR